jgi:hypothetical protein
MVVSLMGSVPEIGGDHVGVLLDGRRGPLGDDAAVVEDDDAVGHAHDHRHVVLDEEDRDPLLLDGAEELHEARGLGGVHAGDWLVEEQHGGLGRERERHPDEALVAVGQSAGKLEGAPLEADEPEDRPGFIFQLLLGSTLARESQKGVEHGRAAAAVQPDQHILEDGVVLKHAGALEGAHEAQARHFMRLEAVEGNAFKAHLSPRWAQEAGDHVEGRGLTGAVRADEPEHLAFVDIECHVGDGDEAAEMNGHMLDGENRLAPGGAHARLPLAVSAVPSASGGMFGVAGAIRRSTAGTMPCGSTKTMKIMNRP